GEGGQEEHAEQDANDGRSDSLHRCPPLWGRRATALRRAAAIVRSLNLVPGKAPPRRAAHSPRASPGLLADVREAGFRRRASSGWSHSPIDRVLRRLDCPLVLGAGSARRLPGRVAGGVRGGGLGGPAVPRSAPLRGPEHGARRACPRRRPWTSRATARATFPTTTTS